MSCDPVSYDPVSYDIVIPTIGRPELDRLLDSLAAGSGPRPGKVVVVDDRHHRGTPAAGRAPGDGANAGVVVMAGRAAGPAAARNLGWRACASEWVAFLDDDVVPDADWAEHLAADLSSAGADVAATQGRLDVPLPLDRRPTDWERNVAGLATARWATADMAYRRRVLDEVGGFDERFPRAYREDADLGLRVVAAGYRIVAGTRRVTHPVRPAPWHVSVGKQTGNADDALMARTHGRGWRHRAGAPGGQRSRHLAVTATALVAISAQAARRHRLAAVAAAGWLAATVDLTWRRVAPGPRTAGEVAAMAATSAAIPPVATAWWLAGQLRPPGPRPPVARRPSLPAPDLAARATTPGDRTANLAAATPRPPVEAVLFDRDGTLVLDVAYNGDPERVVPIPGARASLDRLRRAGVALAVVTNQSGIARGLVDAGQVRAVNARVEALLGAFDAVHVCPHGIDDGCECRKPRPGMIRKAAADLGVDPAACVVVGDIGSDVDAGLAAGARAILVPTTITRPEEIAAAPEVAPDLASAVDRILATPVQPH